MKTTVAMLLWAAAAAAADFPQAEISNGVIKAKLLLPDAERGYYRGTRFDWAGLISSLEWNGHRYFGQWFEKYDPKIHDAVQGPVEEFMTPDGSATGFEEVKPGEAFLRIGVGALKKPDERTFRRFGTYDIVDGGKWTTEVKPDHAVFTHTMPDTAGYAYHYRKTVRLTKGKPQLVLEHTLRNTGRKAIDTNVYNHDFYMLDGQPTGPDVVVRFPFEVRAAADLRGMAETRGKELVYLKELEKGQSAASDLTGFGETAKDHDIRVENRKTGAGVRQTGDRPLAKLYYWSIRTTACPEAYIHMKIEPGKEFTWRTTYDFYSLKP